MLETFTDEEEEDWKKKFLNRIVQGDSAELLKEIPPKQINLVVTSPPYYKQRDYVGIGNEPTLEEYIKNVLTVFQECVRIVKDDGSLVFNLGDKYEHGNLLMAPFKFAMQVSSVKSIRLVNIINWVKENPTPRQYKRRLVSSWEPFFHFVKSDKYYYNRDAFMSLPNTNKPKKVSKNLGRTYFKLIERSTLSDSQKARAKRELRKVIQEVRDGEVAGFRMKIRGIHAPAFGGQEGGRKTQMEKKGFTIIRILGNSIKRDVIECPVETIKGGKHPAIYPEFIIQELIILLTRPNDIVLDPFIGSGTTAVAAERLGRNFIGIDINPEYCEYARQSLSELRKQAKITKFV